MAKGPEARFRTAIERLLPKEIYVEGMANPYRGGTPDRYYEASGGILWAEYKWMKCSLTELQKRWMRRADNNKVNICVIVGRPDGGIILRCHDIETSINDFEILAKKEIAQWIARETLNGIKRGGSPLRQAH